MQPKRDGDRTEQGEQLEQMEQESCQSMMHLTILNKNGVKPVLMKILVCMDSSIFADEIVNIISKRAWICGTRFHLITVVNTSGIADYDNQLLHQAEQILQARVQVLQDRMKNHRAQISSDVLEGRPAPTIIQAAKDCRADLILIGSHGDTGVRKAGIGSVAGAVVNEAPCSVEVVKMVKRHRDRAGAKAS